MSVLEVKERDMFRKQGPISVVRRGKKLDSPWDFVDGLWVPHVGGGAYDTTKGMDYYFEDFHGDLIPDELATTSDTGTITTNVGLSARASILRIDNSNDGDDEMAEVDYGALAYTVQDGQMFMEARVLVERTTGAINVGFNDETTAAGNTLPVELATASFTSTASTWIGFLWDSDATNSTFHYFWVDDDGDTGVAIATLNTGITLAAATWYTIRVHLFDAGSGNRAAAVFSISDGTNTLLRRHTDTIDRDQAMTWHLAVENRTTTGCYLDIDYVEAAKSRQDTAP